MFGKESVELIIPSEENLEMMKLFENINCYDILKSIYKDKEILLSNWDKVILTLQENIKKIKYIL